MKMDVFVRRCFPLTVSAWLVGSLSGWAQTDAAYRQELEERYERLRIRSEETQAAQVLLQKRLSSLSDEIQSLRQQLDRSGPDYATKDDLKRLADSIREIDRKREEDKRLILDELRKLANAPLPEVAPPKKKDKPAPAEPAPAAGPRKGYEYEIKSGDTIGAIVAAYQQSGVKVTVQQVLKANPTLNANRLTVGKKIFIPDPNAP
jgi:hypothetical protein